MQGTVAWNGIKLIGYEGNVTVLLTQVFLYHLVVAPSKTFHSKDPIICFFIFLFQSIPSQGLLNNIRAEGGSFASFWWLYKLSLLPIYANSMN